MPNSINAVWFKTTKELLDVQYRRELRIEMLSFFEKAEADELAELDMLINAVNRAKDGITDVRFAKVNAQIQNLQNASSMTFMGLVFDLAMSAALGGIIGGIAKASFGRMLKSQLLTGTVKTKVRVYGENNGFMKNKDYWSKKYNQSVKNNPFKPKHNKRHDFYDFTMIREIDLAPDSFASTFMAKAPGIVASSTVEGLKGLENVKPLNKNKTITISEFFSNEITVLTSRKAEIRVDYIQTRNELEKKFINGTEQDIKELIHLTHNIAKFEKKNLSAKTNIAVRPGFEASVNTFLSTGKLPWNSNDSTTVIECLDTGNWEEEAVDPFLTITEEIKAQQGAVFFKSGGTISHADGDPGIILTGDLVEDRDENGDVILDNGVPVLVNNTDFTKDDVNREINIAAKIYMIISVDVEQQKITLDENVADPNLSKAQFGIGAKAIGVPWMITIPTSLVILQEGNTLPEIEE